MKRKDEIARLKAEIEKRDAVIADLRMQMAMVRAVQEIEGGR